MDSTGIKALKPKAHPLTPTPDTYPRPLPREGSVNLRANDEQYIINKIDLVN